MQLRKINQDHYVVVTDEPILYTNFSGLVYVNGEIRQYTEAFGITDANTNCKKISHSTEPLEQGYGSVIKDGVMIRNTNKELCYWKIEPLSLSYIKSLVGEVDVEKKAEHHYDMMYLMEKNDDIKPYVIRDYSIGYNQCLEDNKDKRFTMQDMLEAYRKGGNVGAAFEAINQHDYNDAKKFEKHEDEKFIASLQPKDTWECEFIDGELKLK